jgi:hypothetical protein
VLGSPNKEDEEAFYRALGRYVHTLNGRYYTFLYVIPRAKFIASSIASSSDA